MSFVSLLQAAQTPTGQMGSFAGSMVLMFVILYFFFIRPQRKRQKETEKMLAAIKKGDKVVSIGGIHGVVTSTKEKTVIVKVDDNTKLEFNRTAIASVENAESEKAGENKSEKTDN